MLRPERMSRISVTGSKRVMDDVIETVHDLHLLHVTEYDGIWEGFEPGDPEPGADEASDKLVTVRSLQSILGVGEENAGPSRIVDDDALAENLEEVRQEVNELDDRRDDLEDDLRNIQERIDALGPFVELGIDFDLLSGYDTLAVAVGEGDRKAIERALTDEDAVDEFELFSEGDVIAVFAYPNAGLEDALVGAEFTQYEIPAAEGAPEPEERVVELEHRRQQLRSKLTTVEDQLESLRLDYGGFLLAAEEELAIEVQKREVPLAFATTENAFVAEGWIPSEHFDDLAEALHDTVGDHVDVEELERAAYDEHGYAHHIESVEASGAGGKGEAVADGGTAVAMSSGDPPVIQDNPDLVQPFEMLVEVINRPNYHELDPTIVLFLTFPVFYGFMIGDLGYGLLYTGFGFLLMSRFDSDIIRSLGGIGVFAGIFTMVFGILYGEVFGLEFISEIVWGGHPPLRKGLRPEFSDWALGWLVLSLLVGIAHLTIGWIFDFYENLSHGFSDAMTESGSWLLMMFGLWTWIFSGAFGASPDLLYGAESVFNGNPFPLGFTGFAPGVGLAGLVAFAVGFVLLVYGEPIEAVEFLNVLVNVLSYTRIAAVLLAKAGMAFVVNLLFFGVYVTETEEGDAWHFGVDGMPSGPGVEYHGEVVKEIMFGGLAHGPLAAVIGGVVILVVGHLLVLILGVTSAGLQAVRLEYVEFFGKFYEGGGRPYTPFGHDREYTTEE